MSHQVVWTKIVLETFIAEANLTELEEQVMRTRCAGWTRTKQADKLNISLSTLDRIIKRLKVKYDKAQKYSLILPARKDSAEETYLDEH